MKECPGKHLLNLFEMKAISLIFGLEDIVRFSSKLISGKTLQLFPVEYYNLMSLHTCN